MPYIFDFPVLTEGLSSLPTNDLIDAKKSQAVSEKIKLILYPPQRASVLPFLSTRLGFLRRSISYLDCLQHSVSKVNLTERVTTELSEQCREVIYNIEEARLLAKPEIIASRTHHDRIARDMSNKLQPLGKDGPNLEKEFARAMMYRMKPPPKSLGGKDFNAIEFREAVLLHYETGRVHYRQQQAFCQLGNYWRRTEEVRVAHILPKALEEEQLALLFGRNVQLSTDPENALTLTTQFEKALDKGDLVFVPVPGQVGAWKCVVTGNYGPEALVCEGHKWKDIHGKTLIFNGDGRPKRRYLFFRYLITYLLHKMDHHLEWAEAVHSEYEAWASPSEHPQRPALREPLQQALGTDLPETMFRMFDDGTLPDLGLVELDFGNDQPIGKEERPLRMDTVGYAIDAAVHDLPRRQQHGCDDASDSNSDNSDSDSSSDSDSKVVEEELGADDSDGDGGVEDETVTFAGGD